jgi:hypothetical protein
LIKECSTCKLWNGKIETHKTAHCNHPNEIHKRNLGWITPAKFPDDICEYWIGDEYDVYGDSIKF